jgi:hypothetical protein
MFLKTDAAVGFAAGAGDAGGAGVAATGDGGGEAIAETGGAGGGGIVAGVDPVFGAVADTGRATDPRAASSSRTNSAARV